MLKEKYSDVLKLGESLDVKEGFVEEASGKLKIGGKVTYALDRDRLWDAIKEHPGWETEVEAQIDVQNSEVYGLYTVQSGDTLWKIAKNLLGEGSRYQEIFQINRDQLKDPDKIQVGQELKLPNRT